MEDIFSLYKSYTEPTQRKRKKKEERKKDKKKQRATFHVGMGLYKICKCHSRSYILRVLNTSVSAMGILIIFLNINILFIF